MAQGLAVISGAMNGHAGFSIRLNNGTFVVTAGDVVYLAPWVVFRSNSSAASNEAFSMLKNDVGVSGTNASVYGELVFESGSQTITGMFSRHGDVEAALLIAPDRLTFEAGETAVDFSITFDDVNGAILKVDRPAWVGKRSG